MISGPIKLQNVRKGQFSHILTIALHLDYRDKWPDSVHSMPVVKLAHRHFQNEAGPPLVILHGLLGESRNWVTVGKRLSEHFDVYALDLRNHGDSPHSDIMDYPELVQDILNWMAQHLKHVPILLGHSFGGKIAMRLAATHPDQIKALVVADIAPKPYQALEEEFQALGKIQPEVLKSRKDAEALLEESLSEFGLRRFLLNTICRAEEGTYKWKTNVPGIAKNRHLIAENSLPESSHYNGPTLFIKGGLSPFIKEGDHSIIKAYFPKSILKSIPDAGHNVHIDAPDDFVQLFTDYARSAILD